MASIAAELFQVLTKHLYELVFYESFHKMPNVPKRELDAERASRSK